MGTLTKPLSLKDQVSFQCRLCGDCCRGLANFCFYHYTTAKAKFFPLFFRFFPILRKQKSAGVYRRSKYGSEIFRAAQREELPA